MDNYSTQVVINWIAAGCVLLGLVLPASIILWGLLHG